MKVVLSRKGFDSSNGGSASPILPDGRMLSLPIPAGKGRYTFDDVWMEGINISKMVADLTGKIITHVHLDPDLNRLPAKRPANWRPAFGQVNAAQTYLANRYVGKDDVFLFFGWFRKVEEFRGKWRYIPEAPNIHVLYGWLEIDEVLSVDNGRDESEYTWLQGHPHFHFAQGEHKNNTVYIAKQKSDFSTLTTFGGGIFPYYAPELQLTQDGKPRSDWLLPRWFYPEKGKSALSSHDDLTRWTLDDTIPQDKVALRILPQGQEFVIDGAEYPELSGWVADIVAKNAK
jgi:hypothetical protein bpseBC_38923